MYEPMKPLDFIEYMFSNCIEKDLDKRKIMDEVAGAIYGFSVCGFLTELEKEKAYELLDQFVKFAFDSFEHDYPDYEIVRP